MDLLRRSFGYAERMSETPFPVSPDFSHFHIRFCPTPVVCSPHSCSRRSRNQEHVLQPLGQSQAVTSSN